MTIIQRGSSPKPALYRSALLTAAFTLALTLPVALQAKPLPEVLQQVLASHPDVRSAGHLLEAAKARVTQAKSAYYPVLGFNHEFSDTQGTQYGNDTSSNGNRTDAILSWTLFNGFANRYGVESTRRQQAATQAELEATHQAVALEVTDAYLALLRLTYRTSRNQQYMNELRALVSTIDTRASSGRLSTAESTQAQTRLIQAENAHSQLLAQLGAARARYTELTGESPAGLSYPSIDTSLVNLSADELHAMALNNNPNLAASRAQAEARESGIGQAKAEYFPTIGLEVRKRLADDSTAESSYNEDLGTSLQMTYQVPFGGGAFGRKTEAERQMLSAEEKTRSLKMEIQTSIGELQARLRENLRIGPRLRDNIQASAQVYDAYDLQFNAGRRSLLDLLSALSEKHGAYANVIDNWYQSTLMAAQLHALTGSLQQAVQNPASRTQ